ncbi:MAG TPA: GAF domain-containing protein, partial [Niastella sp.]|nr:GAF domain-containing protein [Niastella sp.]
MNKASFFEFEAPVPTISSLEQERKILLDLGSDLTRVRDKSDLIMLFSKRLKGLFNFTHAIITIFDYKTETYGAFLYDISTSPIKIHPRYQKLFETRFPLNEPFIERALLQAAKGPVSFILEEVINDQPQCPAYIKVNYEGGIREILMTKLQHAEQPIGFMHVYSTTTGSFTPEFRSVMSRIAPQLSSAVTNIIKNEDVLEKEQEKSFLLDFSVDVAHVKTKAELQTAIFNVLDKLLHTKLAMIRVIEEDGIHLPAYMYDHTLFGNAKPTSEVMAANRITIDEPYTAKVLASVDGLVFNVEEELRSGNDYAKLWKTTGLR